MVAVRMSFFFKFPFFDLSNKQKKTISCRGMKFLSFGISNTFLKLSALCSFPYRLSVRFRSTGKQHFAQTFLMVFLLPAAFEKKSLSNLIKCKHSWHFNSKSESMKCLSSVSNTTNLDSLCMEMQGEEDSPCVDDKICKNL